MRKNQQKSLRKMGQKVGVGGELSECGVLEAK